MKTKKFFLEEFKIIEQRRKECSG